MPYQTQYKYFAGKNFAAEHPIGSGNIVQYKTGDPVPAGEWGRSVHWLLEGGKLKEMVDNVWVDDDDADAVLYVDVPVRDEQVLAEPPKYVHVSVPEIGVTAEQVNQEQHDAAAKAEGFPFHKGGPWYELSDGTQVRGKAAAIEAEAKLGENDE